MYGRFDAWLYGLWHPYHYYFIIIILIALRRVAPMYTCGLADRNTRLDTAMWLGATTTRELGMSPALSKAQLSSAGSLYVISPVFRHALRHAFDHMAGSLYVVSAVFRHVIDT